MKENAKLDMNCLIMNAKTACPSDYIGYRCTGCGAINVKLWKHYGSGNRNGCAKLYCKKCCQDEQHKDARVSGRTIRRIIEKLGIYYEKVIGDYIPAIPDKNGYGYECYEEISRQKWEWWLNLETGESGSA